MASSPAGVLRSLCARTVVASWLGVLSPLILDPLDSIVPTAGFLSYVFVGGFLGLFVSLSVLLVFAFVTVGLLGQYRFGRSGWVQTLCIMILFDAALLGSAWCYKNHVCKDGHGAHGIPAMEWVIDMVWTSGLVASVVWAVRARSLLSVPCAYIGGFVISFRFVFGSMGGMYQIPI